MDSRIGIIAGGGELPLLLNEALARKGLSPFLFPVLGSASEGLLSQGKTIDLLHLEEGLAVVHSQGIRRVILAGQVNHSLALGSLPEEVKTLINEGGGGRSAMELFAILKRLFKRFDMEIVPYKDLLPEAFPAPGTLIGMPPCEEMGLDLSLGFKTARRMAELDIGQSVITKKGLVVTVEDLEGTDRMIDRAADLVGPGFSLVKVARPDQDPAFDVPVVGPLTMEKLVRYKAAALGVEGGETLFIDLPGCLEMARRSHITVVAE